MKYFKRIIPAIISSLLLYTPCFSQTEIPDTLKTSTGNIYGTLAVPGGKGKVPVVLIISGSGPTDRDGNSPMMTNNSLRMVADSLSAYGIASLRYDKRGIAASTPSGGLKEGALRIENYMDDAAAWIKLLKNDSRFSKVIVAGHSEGSLIGMVAAKSAGADAFISISGAGRSADILLKEQIAKQSPTVSATINVLIDSLKNGQLLKQQIAPSLNALFRPSVQPYLISWFKYDPQTEIAKLTQPVLILQGNTDIQVSTGDALLLAKADSKATLKIIKGMNHILKTSTLDRRENIATYTDPGLPLPEELVGEMVKFINGRPSQDFMSPPPSMQHQE